IAVALLSAYLHQAVSQRALFVGQVDLRLNIRSPDPPYIAALANAINDDMLIGVDRLYLSSSASSFLAELLSPSQAQGRLEIVGVGTFAELVESMWPGTIRTVTAQV